MDKSVLSVLKMLSAREISVQSADRILRALELLQKNEEGEAVDSSTLTLVTEEQGIPVAAREEIEGIAKEIQEAKGDITNGAKLVSSKYRVRAFVYVGVFAAFAAFALMGLASLYEAKLEGLQARVYDQTVEAERLGSEIQECRDLFSTFSKKGKRKPLGIFTVTAYDPIKSCKPFDDGITSKGIPAGMGVAAVDPKVIPYGSVLYLPELGKYFFASDTGAAMKKRGGRNIDLLMPTVEDALQFGRKRLEVELIDLSAN